MANTIITIKSSGETGNTPSSLQPGELAINYADGNFYYGNNTLDAVLFETVTDPAGLNGEIQFNDLGVFGSSQNLSFDVSTETLTVTNIEVLNDITVSNLSIATLNATVESAFITANNAQITSSEAEVLANTEVENVLYVSKSGSDDNDGKTLSKSFLTLEAALAVATGNTTIYLKSGEYVENNPLTVPARVAIVGDNLRTTSVKPSNTTSDIFYVNNACYITGITFRGHVSGAAAVAFNPDSSAGTITTSPYIQNCSSITTTGVGMRIDGSYVSGLKSMVSDSYTQINEGGIGVHILNGGYAQLVSIFTICTDVGVLCESGGQCSITNSNSSFGTYGLKANGVSTLLFTGSSNGADQTGTSIVVDGLSTRPAINDVVQFDGDSNYYTIAGTTALSSGETTLTLQEEIVSPIANDTTASFYRRSLISASSHTFEYVGTGNSLTTALPQAGGIPVQENEVIEENGGNVYFTSTDHKGDFRIGGELLINRTSGTIEGRTFDRSLFSVLTPYILAIEG